MLNKNNQLSQSDSNEHINSMQMKVTENSCTILLAHFSKSILKIMH